jgi:hypothetical protein
MLGDVPRQGGSHECRHTKEVVVSAPQVSPEAFADAMQEKTQEYLRQVMASVNAAPDGDWIAGSEEQVRNSSACFCSGCTAHLFRHDNRPRSRGVPFRALLRDQ